MASQIDAAQRRAEQAAFATEEILGAINQLAYPGATIKRVVARVAKEARRDALEEAKQIAKDELFNTMILLSFPEQSSAAWTIMWKLDRLREGQ